MIIAGGAPGPPLGVPVHVPEVQPAPLRPQVRGLYYVCTLAGGIMEAMATLERTVTEALGRRARRRDRAWTGATATTIYSSLLTYGCPYMFTDAYHVFKYYTAVRVCVCVRVIG